MISMKVLNENEKVIVYLFNDDVDINKINELNDKIRKLFVKLIKRYHFDFFGYSEVTIYHNNKYGLIIEILKLSDFDYEKTIDLKIIVYKNYPMFLEFDDYYFLDKPKKLIYKNNKYYLNLDDITDINKYIEYGKVIIKKNY